MKKYYVLFSALFCLGTFITDAQYTVLHSFDITTGAYPLGALTLSSSKLYGMANGGGVNGVGCIFSMDTSGANYKDIFDFDGENGAYPQGGSLKLSGNKLYGMVAGGGLNDSGCVFSIDTSGADYRDLLDFNGPNGASPIGSLVLSGNKMFGITFTGGVNIMGNIFTMDTNGNNYKDLFDFDGTDGQSPYGDVTIIGHKLYGMGGYGGADGIGNIFSMDSDGTGFVDMYDFSGNDGAYPNNLLTLSKYQFFGMTNGGGVNEDGNIFSIDTNGVGFADLVDLDGTTSPYGQYPDGDLVLSGSELYGMAQVGGVNDSGCIFSMDTNYVYNDLFDFNGTNGDDPISNVTISGHTLFGTTAIGGGSNYAGVIFKYVLPSTGINTIKNNASVKLYPNPNNGQFILHVSSGSGASSIEIYNMLGEMVYSATLVQGQSDNAINISSRPPGMYLYRVLSDTGALIGEYKFVVQ